MIDLWNVLDDVMRTDPWFRPFLTEPESESASSSPLVDVSEMDTGYVINAELPGVKLEDVKLEIDNGVLTLSAQKRADNDGEERAYHRVERRYGTFTRSFALPRGVQTDGVQATMRDGVLAIHLPKSEQARARRVPIAALSAGGAPAQLTAEASRDASGEAAA
jgi:HSP20 family protein